MPVRSPGCPDFFREFARAEDARIDTPGRKMSSGLVPHTGWRTRPGRATDRSKVVAGMGRDVLTGVRKLLEVLLERRMLVHETAVVYERRVPCKFSGQRRVIRSQLAKRTELIEVEASVAAFKNDRAIAILHHSQDL